MEQKGRSRWTNCGIFGANRVRTRADLAAYRTWNYCRFMFTMTGSIIGRIVKWGIAYGIVAAGVAFAYKHTKDEDFWNDITMDSHKLLLIPLAFLLVFRANVAYGRFWEGRGHMGGFYKELRDICRKANTLITNDDDPHGYAHVLRSNICRLLPVCAVTTQYNLRKRSAGMSPEQVLENYKNDIKAWLTPEELDLLVNHTKKNRPYRVINWIGHAILTASKAKKGQNGDGASFVEGGPPTYASFDNHCGALILTWMGMNKICFTPTPFPYIHMLNWFLMIFLGTVPFPLAPKIGYWMIIALPMLSMAMYAIEEVAQEIEDPFGDDLNDLMTESIAPGLVGDSKLAANSVRNANQAVVLEPNGVDTSPDEDESAVTGDMKHRT